MAKSKRNPAPNHSPRKRRRKGELPEIKVHRTRGYCYANFGPTQAYLAPISMYDDAETWLKLAVEIYSENDETLPDDWREIAAERIPKIPVLKRLGADYLDAMREHFDNIKDKSDQYGDAFSSPQSCSGRRV